MRHVKVRLGVFYGCGGSINTYSRLMQINPKIMQVRAQDEDMSFEEHFAIIVSHEFIHQIITDIESDDASSGFDSVCWEKHKQFKYWIGGIGWRRE